ncbi:MAG: IS110 family transposase [Actinomycetota bacterium]
MNTPSTKPIPHSFFTGIDYHKRYSVYCVVDATGEIQARGRILHATPSEFAALVKKWRGRVVFEASMNWHWLYELLEREVPAEDILLANPFKTRLIAEAQVKTDKVDAHILAQLLRFDWIPQVHIPAKETRQRKEVLRQRCYFVRHRTMLRNRIHRLLGGQHDLKLPQVSDLFGKKGMSFLERLELPAPAGLLLKQQLEMLRTVQMRIKEDEVALEAMIEQTPAYRRLLTLPGMGPILAAVVSSEIDEIARFRTAQKLCGYAGLCPTTSSSGDKTYQGRLMRHCNKWLRWGFVEAAWVAVGCSPYFGDFYKRKRALGKKANTAILATARRMARIAWQLLTEARDFDTNPPAPKTPGRKAPVASAAVPPLSERRAAAAKKQPRTTNTFPSRSDCTLAGRRE